MALSCGIKWSYFNDLLELRKKSVVNGWFPTNPGKTPQSDDRYITQLTITIVNYSIPWKSHYKRTPNPKQCIISQFFLGQMPSNQQHVASSVEFTLPLNIDGWTTIRLCFGGPDFSFNRPVQSKQQTSINRGGPLYYQTKCREIPRNYLPET